MKFGFVTCVQLGFSCIEKIYEIGGKLDLVITLHDHKSKNKSGRIYLDSFCNRNSIPLLKVNHINDAEVKEAIKANKIDWLFIIGWSQIASSELLNTPRKGAIGMHPTLLPEGRGRAAIPWAIIKGLHKTGVTMFKLEEGVDTGPILDQYEIGIDDNETSGTLYKKVNSAHEILIAKIWDDLKNDNIQPMVQDETKATYWEGRTPADGEIKNNMSLDEVDKLVRATTHPYPGAFLKNDNVIVRIWSGKPVKDRNPNSPNAFYITLLDGIYEAIEYEKEFMNK